VIFVTTDGGDGYCRRAPGGSLDGASQPHDNPLVAPAELLVLLVIGGACYAALAPLRRAIERWWLRRERRPGQVISLARDGEGVYRRLGRKSDGDQR